jgi:hypothetical protein
MLIDSGAGLFPSTEDERKGKNKKIAMRFLKDKERFFLITELQSPTIQLIVIL